MTRLGFIMTSTSKRARGATGEACPEQLHAQQSSVRDFARIEAVESRSILGEHDGTLSDDLMDLLEDATA